jgi:prepilin-type N-terminal cleavage/methylation domain-containing protein/prepilin-type processing-associated H-X9-DG protein
MKKTAFTLIELLIVIVIISMILSILLPALNHVKQSAKTVLCGSNLKHLYLSLSIYGQNNGTFPHGFNDSINFTSPPAGGYPGDASKDKQGIWWFQAIYDEKNVNFNQDSIAQCPSNSLRNIRLRSNVLCGNYGINRYVCKDSEGVAGFASNDFVGKPLSLSSINNPAKTLLLVDSGYSIISWRGASNISGLLFDNPLRESAFYVPGVSANKDRPLLPEFSEDALKGRHPNRTVNTIFADGHLARTKADELSVEESNDTYINRSPLWLPK